MKKTETKVVAVVMGTRPEVIKLAPVIHLMKADRSLLEPRVIVTAQHREMMDQMLEVFHIRPDHDLNVMKKDQTLHDVVADILKRIREVFNEISPSLVLVQGDTTTTFASALAAFYDKIPVGHVEAGLRTYDHYYPFPEEMNRRLVSDLAQFHFAPTPRAAEALKKEGIPEKNIFITGNTVIDALKWIQSQKPPLFPAPLMDKDKKEIVLVTAHRRENLDGGLENICRAVRQLLEKRKETSVVFPIHLNPRVQQVVRKYLSNTERVFLCEPLEYRSFVELMRKSKLILTDSGGIQEEAPSLGTPVVVLRNETERTEALDSHLISLAGLDTEKIVQESLRFLNQKRIRQKNGKNPYGDGKASERIVAIIERLARKGIL